MEHLGTNKVNTSDLFILSLNSLGSRSVKETLRLQNTKCECLHI